MNGHRGNQSPPPPPPGRRRRPALLGPLAATGVIAVTAAVAATATPAAGFGTTGHAQHERITRLALACAAGASSDGSCFEPRSLDQLAGRSGSFGAIGTPDVDEIATSAAHCDNADYLAVSGYPQTRAQATDRLRSCISHLRGRFTQAVDAAGALLTSGGSVDPAAVTLSPDCVFVLGVPGRAKCNVIEGFGRALHGVQDFYSHSNWTDTANPNAAIGLTNPPGLNRSAPATLTDLRGSSFADVPDAFTTGYFNALETALGCSAMATLTDRVTHKCLNKDTETIDLTTGAVSSPTTDRGKVGSNAAKSVAGAIADTRRQWQDLRAALLARYGSVRGATIVRALTRDTP